MQKLVIQRDVDYLSAVDSFVSAICDNNYIDYYYASISVPVLKAIEMAFNSSSEVELNCVCSSHDIKLNIAALSGSFSSLLPHSTDINSMSDEVLLISSLVDEYCVSEDGSSLELLFAIHGISPKEVSKRIAVIRQHDATVSSFLIKDEVVCLEGSRQLV